MSKTRFEEIDLSLIKVSKTNPRKHFEQDSINELADSIKEKGVIQPIIVRQILGCIDVELVCGERRYRASKIAGKTTIPCIIRQLSDEEAFDLQIIENLQRKDVHPMDEAVAFQSLQIMKKFDIEEISKRVAKSTTYVAQRLRLNELIEEFQKAFFEDKMILGTAIQLAKFSAIDQKDMWNSEFQNKSTIVLEKWIVNKYKLSLNNAPFDINDAELSQTFGACIGCNYNSASHMLLFPDADKDAVCLNGSCFKSKVDKHFQSGLDIAINDLGTILIIGAHKHSDLSKSIIEQGHTVYLYTQFDAEDFSDEEPQIEEYKERLTDGWYDTEEEMMDDFNADLNQYKQDLAEYTKKLNEGQFLKGYYIDGNNKGKTIPVTLKNAKPSETGSTITLNPIHNELSRLDEQESRKKELDEEKIHAKIFSYLNDGVKPAPAQLLPVEQIAFVIALASKSFEVREYLEEVHGLKSDYTEHFLPQFEKLSELPSIKVEGIVNEISRIFILEELKPVNGAPNQRPSANGKCAAIRSVANVYIPELVVKIELEQNEIAEKRIERYKTRKAQLEKNAGDKEPENPDFKKLAETWDKHGSKSKTPNTK